MVPHPAVHPPSAPVLILTLVLVTQRPDPTPESGWHGVCTAEGMAGTGTRLTFPFNLQPQGEVRRDRWPILQVRKLRPRAARSARGVAQIPAKVCPTPTPVVLSFTPRDLTSHPNAEGAKGNLQNRRTRPSSASWVLSANRHGRPVGNGSLSTPVPLLTFPGSFAHSRLQEQSIRGWDGPRVIFPFQLKAI